MQATLVGSQVTRLRQGSIAQQKTTDPRVREKTQDYAPAQADGSSVEALQQRAADKTVVRKNRLKMVEANQALREQVAAKDQQLSKVEEKNKELEKAVETETAARKEEEEKRKRLTDLRRTRMGFTPFVQQPPKAK
ncbi:hypothetical protein ABW21_db0201391 [Orbilia brochopaga]|nr:hypothetical protein ABW21_db0201391 [Drechslerella brochopaga]